MKIEKVKIPNVNDINFYQIGLIDEFTKIEDIEVEDVIYFLSNYLKISQSDLENSFISDVKNLYNLVLDSLKDVEQTSIQTEIEIKGQVYTFRLNDKLPAIWYMTSQRVIAQGSTLPSIAALSYVEKDQQFNKTDFEKRKEIFAEHLTYSTYRSIQGFFLEKWNQFQELFSLAKEMEVEINPQLMKLSSHG